MEQVQDIRSEIDAAVQRLVAAYEPACVVLFGSQAWGAPHRDSDVDFFIIKETSERALDRHLTVRKVLHAPFPFDVWVLTPQEVQRRLRRGDRFVAQILERGTVLYAKKAPPGTPPLLDTLEREKDAMPAPEDAEYPSDWMRIAEKDWQRARLLLDASDPEGAGFHLQQAVEKSLKGFLLSRGWALRKTHNLKELLKEAAAYDASLQDFHEVCEHITEFYFAERYPAMPGEERRTANVSEEGVRQAMDRAEQLVERLRTALNREQP